jgi:hypothetical protein
MCMLGQHTRQQGASASRRVEIHVRRCSTPQRVSETLRCPAEVVGTLVTSFNTVCLIACMLVPLADRTLDEVCAVLLRCCRPPPHFARQIGRSGAHRLSGACSRPDSRMHENQLQLAAAESGSAWWRAGHTWGQGAGCRTGGRHGRVSHTRRERWLGLKRVRPRGVRGG